MIFYVSVRPIRIETRLLSPKEHFKYGYQGMNVSFNCLSAGTENDGRWLYEVGCDDVTAQEVILEGLQMWGVHLKTLESAKVLAEKLTGLEWIIEREKIIPVIGGI